MNVNIRLIVIKTFLLVALSFAIAENYREIVFLFFITPSQPFIFALLGFGIYLSFHNDFFSVSDFLDNFKAIFNFNVLCYGFPIKLIL
jgi:hypothetical protein